MDRSHLEFLHFHLHPSIPIPAGPSTQSLKRRHSHPLDTSNKAVEPHTEHGHKDHLRVHSRLAEAYDSLDSKSVVKEHWSSKARDDMTERDWRIFREDFNISYKGASHTKATLPIRNWAEAGLPDALMQVVPWVPSLCPHPAWVALFHIWGM